jgi:O-acetyl-ADP-ribose deacetylase (regulator of RNase III)
MCYDKPTYEDLRKSLELAKKQCLSSDIQKIALPQIGCGLDRLSWDRVRRILQEIFADTNIELVVYIY